MKLYLVQHGEALSKKADPERPLTEQGKIDVEHLAVFLGQAHIGVESVIHSGKLRARQTAERLARVIAPEVKAETSNSISPNDNPVSFVEQLGGRAGDMLVVGHLPFMAKLVSQLLIEDASRLLTAFQPGSMVCLELNDTAGWQINWMIRPELLR